MGEDHRDDEADQRSVELLQPRPPPSEARAPMPIALVLGPRRTGHQTSCAWRPAPRACARRMNSDRVLPPLQHLLASICRPSRPQLLPARPAGGLRPAQRGRTPSRQHPADRRPVGRHLPGRRYPPHSRRHRLSGDPEPAAGWPAHHSREGHRRSWVCCPHPAMLA